MKGSRNLPITTLVNSIYFWLGELFARNGLDAQAPLQLGTKFSYMLMKVMKFNLKYINTINV
ncbi:hypothetical protein AHAS_Ahas10G0092800 [Arachis hypogaea]